MTIHYVVDGVTKSYGNTEVLKDIHLQFNTGEIHALVGHNGAGKSTLLRILSGVERADRGIINLGSKVVSFSSPREAQMSGVTCVYQELRLVSQLTVAENIFLGQELRRNGVLQRAEMNRQADQLLKSHGLNISPTDKVSQLSHPQRQLVEIISALHKNARFLLLDEPTTSLEYQQISELLSTIRNLVQTKDVGVVLVTHKLDEVYQVCDKVTVLCDGEVVLAGTTKDVPQQEVIGFIIGREDNAGYASDSSRINQSNASRVNAQCSVYPSDATNQVREDSQAKRPEMQGSTAVRPNERPVMPVGEPSVRVRHLKTAKIKDVTLDAFERQVLGIYGLGGSGRTEFLRALFGIDAIVSGTVTLQGKPFAPKSPRAALQRGLAYITEERKVDGFIPLMDSVINVGLPVVARFANFGFISKRQLQKAVVGLLQPLQLRGDIYSPIQSLSGGNQQKVLFARSLMQEASVLLLDEPTKGIDIGAKGEIYSLIRSLVASKPITVVVVSSEEEEILTLSDQVAIFHAGTCDGRLYAADTMTTTQLRTLALQEGCS